MVAELAGLTSVGAGTLFANAVDAGDAKVAMIDATAATATAIRRGENATM
jgi:hypothetical protein